MITKIFLHTGLHKTGTTSIQNAFAENREFLGRIGYLYPCFKDKGMEIQNHSVPLFSMFCGEPENYHINMMRNNTSPESITSLHEAYADQLTGQIRSFPGNTMILSGEDISKLSEDELVRLREFLRSVTCPSVVIEVITIVRNPVDWFDSLAQQWIKLNNATLENMNEIIEMADEYLNVLTRLPRVFGEGNIHFFKFEDLISYEKGLVAAFFQVIERNPEKPEYLDWVDKANNTAIKYESAMILDSLYRKYPRFVNHRLNSIYSESVFQSLFRMPGTKFQLDGQIHRRAWRKFSEKINHVCVESGLMPYEFYRKPETSVQDTWKPEVLDYLAKTIPALSRELAADVMSLLLRELKRNRYIFPVHRQLGMLALVLWFYNCSEARSRRQKALYLASRLGLFQFFSLSVLYLVHKKTLISHIKKSIDT